MTPEGQPTFRLRPEQQAIVHGYSGGKLGIAAVPGSGKTFTLAHLAARLISKTHLAADQEVLVVTFTNSAVNSFRARIAETLTQDYGLIGHIGYRVRTLHGLARDIVHERPALVGLADDFTILDEKETQEIQRGIVIQCLAGWRDTLTQYLDPQVDSRWAWRGFEDILPQLAGDFIRQAKDLRRTPDDLLALLPSGGASLDLARFAISVYADYQRSLAYRGAVDFDDLVRLALDALEREPAYLERLRQRWPYILEDEAQDSSRLQEEMLRLLSGERNWVRVGDPNQAIYTTFTTANPDFLRRFLDREDVEEKPLSVSGRSALPIIDLANELVRWTTESHPDSLLKTTFEFQPLEKRGPVRGVIHPTDDDDPDPNPPDDDCHIELRYRPDDKIAPLAELDYVISGAERPLLDFGQDAPQAPQETVAVLVPDNNRGYALAEKLRKDHKDVPFEELLRSSTRTRQSVGRLLSVLDYLCDPDDTRKLKNAFWAQVSDERRELVTGDADIAAALTRHFASAKAVEEFLWPRDPGAETAVPDLGPDYAWLSEALALFRTNVRRWLQVTDLPIDQVILVIAQDLFDAPQDLALGHKVATTLRALASSHPEWRLPQFAEELRGISKNQRRFLGFDDEEAGYAPRPGVVTIATMHSAKGLEWDRVYLLAVSNYDFPSLMPYDNYIGERAFARFSHDGSMTRLNLEAELLAQLDYLVGSLPVYEEGLATSEARVQRARERLRLLYVGITRARRELIVCWNTGRYAHKSKAFENRPALPLVHLGSYRDHSGG
jgi:DNA helicase-2/ATP-dependent DNA helicase PcrA